ncbi:Natural killer cells antigen CD94, partial [Galemys pyrenaicus]
LSLTQPSGPEPPADSTVPSGSSRTSCLPCRDLEHPPHGSFSVEVDFWDTRSDVPFLDGYFGNCVEKFSCPERWVGYQCNCYFISSEAKSWKESSNFCVSKNSTLLYLHNKEELATFRTTLWRWISGMLGIACLSLMATLGIVLKNDTGYSSCQEGWVGYQCNCYFISSEKRTWEESTNFCVSQNSTLLHMHNREELA